MTSKTDVVPKGQASTAVIATADPFLAMIEKVATTPNINVDTLDRLLAMQERVMLSNAEEEFNEKMTACQMEMKSIVADAENPQTRSKYATYQKLDRALRPLYTKHGFAISFNTAPIDGKEAVRVLAYVSRGRFTRPYQVDVPADGKGAKGGDVMTKTHAVGAAMSYGARYLLKFIFNVAVGEDDTDGNTPKDKPTPDEKGRKVLEACGSMASLAEAWNKLSKEQRRTLVEVRDECKAKIAAADKAAAGAK
jgi:ERF superfamily